MKYELLILAVLSFRALLIIVLYLVMCFLAFELLGVLLI